MSRRIVGILAVCGCVLAVGCGPGSPAPAPAEPLRTAGLSLELDEGNKWEVDAHTRRSARALSTSIDGAAPFESADDARALADALDAELQRLIQGCTMTGPAHDQLHIVLAALFPKLRALKETDDLASLRATRTELRAILDAYNDHFR